MGASESKVAPMQVPVPQAKVIVAQAPVKKGKAKATKFGAGRAAAAAGVKAEDPPLLKQNDYELAIRSCKELEFLLETEFGSTGATLHERITNSNASLPIELIMNMRYVATIGNNLIHEKSFSSIPDQGEFIKRYERSINALQEIASQRRIVERRVIEAKQKKREAEIQAALISEDREWLDQQQRQIAEQKQKRIEMEQEKEREAEKLREEAAQRRACACF